MYSSSKKKLEILNDHYKDTFSHLVGYRKQRDRLLLYLLITVGLMSLYQLYPYEITRAISDAVRSKIGVNLRSELLWFNILPIAVIFTISRRYWQVWHLIENQYDYLEKLEKELGSLYASGVPFTRESKFSYKGHKFSIWSHRFYNEFFLIFWLVCPMLGAAVHITNYDFSWRSLIIGSLIPIIFYADWIFRKLTKFWSTRSEKNNITSS